jgi:hypothetical protein
VTVDLWLCRERDDDSQPSVSRVERRLGIIDFWTPKAAKQALWVVAQMTPRRRLKRSRSSLGGQAALQRPQAQRDRLATKPPTELVQ